LQTISGFFKYYSVDLIVNLLNDERRATSLIDFTNESDVCSLRLTQCLRQAEAEVALYISNPDLDDILVQNMVNDFTDEFIYKRKGVLPIPDSIKDACSKHREILLLINQQKLDTFSLPQSFDSEICLTATDEKEIFNYD